MKLRFKFGQYDSNKVILEVQLGFYKGPRNALYLIG